MRFDPLNTEHTKQWINKIINLSDFHKVILKPNSEYYRTLQKIVKEDINSIIEDVSDDYVNTDEMLTVLIADKYVKDYDKFKLNMLEKLQKIELDMLQAIDTFHKRNEE